MCFPGRTSGINKTAITFEDKVYSMAKDKVLKIQTHESRPQAL